MKTKLSFFTRLGNFLLLLSILVQLLYLALLYFVTNRSIGQDSGGTVALGGIINILSMESYMLFGSSIAVASVFRSLFIKQARGELKKLNGMLVTLVIIFVLDYYYVFSELDSWSRMDEQDILQLILCYGIPLLTSIAISFSSRFLAIISALGRIPSTLWNIGVLYHSRNLMGKETVFVMILSELLVGLGIIIGLLGVKKPMSQSE